jgi:phosphate-selective porin OprO/OprP
MRKYSTILAAVAFLVALVDSAFAEPPTAGGQKDQEISDLKSEIKALEQRVVTLEGLDRKVRVIDRKFEVQAQAEQARISEMPVIKAGTDGFYISSPNPKDFQLRLGGIVQADGRFFTNGTDKTPSTFYLNRARPILSATVGTYYDFNITPDFGQGRVVIQDAYINARNIPWAQLQIGKYKAPFGIERLQTDSNLIFSERAETINLVPNRDYGAEIHADLFENRVSYQLALMNGVPNNVATVESDNNDGKDFIGRVFVQPFRAGSLQWAKNLGLGFAATYGDESNATISTYTTYGQVKWFTYNSGVSAAGQRVRLSPQGYYYFGPFGFLAEYVSDTHDLNHRINTLRAGIPHNVNNYSRFTDTGYDLQASYILTAENASYGAVAPKRAFDIDKHSWGAWEVAARLSNVAVDSGAFKLNYANPTVSAKTATEYAFGVNWYLSSNLKWQFDYARTFFDGGGGSGTVVRDRPDESVFESQLQLSF